MSDSSCHFTWVEHQENLVSLVQGLYDNESFFDCKLYAGGHHFDVHRLILSSCSPYLSSILQEHKHENPVITLDGVSSEELRALVEYMYTGETSVAPELLNSFFQITKMLDIAGLSHYNNEDVDQILNGDETIESTDTGFQYDYESDNQSILKYLEQSVGSNEIHIKEEFPNLNLNSENENKPNAENIFQQDASEDSGNLNEQSIIYQKFHTVFMKEESDGSLPQPLITNIQEDPDDSAEAVDDIEDPSEMYDNYDTVFMKQEDDDEDEDDDDDDSLVHTINVADNLSKDCDSDGKGDNDYWKLSDESQIRDEAENYVFVKVDNNLLQRVKGNQITVNQEQSETSDNLTSEKYLKVIGQSKKSFLINRPKIQNLIGKESKPNPDDKKIYICLKCGNKYSHRRTLLHHIHWICDQPATYSCTLCPYMGKRKFQLKSHMKHAHLLRMS